MMKKIIRVTALILALVTLLSVPVSADEYDSMWVSFLDYDTGTSQGNYSVFSGSTEFSYTLPFRTSLRSVQGIIHASSHPITAVKFGKVGSSTTYPCTLISLGNSLYRFYLSRTDVIVNSNEFFIIVENDGTASTVASLLSFEFSQIRSTQYQETGTLYVTGGYLDGSFNKTMGNTGDSVVCHFPQGDLNMRFEAQFYAASWRKYDFLDFWVSGYIDELGSISAGCNGAQLPVSVYYIPVDGSGIVFNTIIRLDVRSIPRTSTYTPMILLDGFSFSNGSGHIELKNVVGIVEIDDIDPEMSILNRILNDMNWYLMSDFSIQTNMSGDIVSGFSDIDLSLSGFRDSVENWFSSISDKLDQLIGGSSEGDSLSDGSQVLESQAADIHDYEQSQQEVLDNNFDTIQDSVSVGRFSAALSFVQRYLNMSWLAIADFSIIYSLPFFIGIFFFICGRLPGATRPKYHPPNYRGGRSNNRGGRSNNRGGGPK